MFGININNEHRGVKKLFRFKFSRNVNKNTITKVIKYAIAEHNAIIDADAANIALSAAVIAKKEADKAIVMVDKFSATTSTYKNRVTIVRLKATEALATAEAIKASTLAKQAAINATETAYLAKTAALALETNIAMSDDIVV